MRNFYIEISSNRYAVNGAVTDWVKVPFNEANYGANYCGSIVCSRTWLFVRDSLKAWYDGQIAAGKSQQQIDAYLAQFDVWDRYDYDGDGNFNEPDGYIDHFQSVHAGEGEETGGGAQGLERHLEPAGTYYSAHGDHGPTTTAAAAPGRHQQLLGRRLPRSSRRTAASACSHEFGHDLGCRSCTIPSATTRPASGRSCRPARTATTARSTSDRSPRTWAPGRSSSSDG
jgi:immune inhibitor A